jgi:hypothetical protein
VTLFLLSICSRRSDFPDDGNAWLYTCNGYCFHPNFHLMWDQVTSLQALPEDVACPILWQDPLADYVIWLA